MPKPKHPTRPIDQRIARAIIEEATERAVRSGPHNCLIWPDRLDANGYGVSAWSGHRAHRLAYAAAHHDPGPLMVRHVVCGNPSCFDWEHLAEGDAAANMADTVRMGRHGNQHIRVLDEEATTEIVRRVNAGAKLADVSHDLGIGYGTVARAVAGRLDPSITPARDARKLTDADVLRARTELARGTASIKGIADRLGISWPTAQKMVQGRTYKHVGGPLAPRPNRAERTAVAAVLDEMRAATPAVAEFEAEYLSSTPDVASAP